jgi:excisionase family DNA binding protein
MSVYSMTEKIYTVKEVAEFLRVTPRTVWKMINQGELEAFQVRGDYRIKQSTLDAFMEKRPKKEES